MKGKVASPKCLLLLSLRLKRSVHSNRAVSTLQYSKNIGGKKNFGEFGKLQHLAKFFHQFLQFPQHFLCKWTSIHQRFFCQTSYSPY